MFQNVSDRETPLHVELRLSCTNKFWMWGTDFEVKSFFASQNAHISVDIGFYFKTRLSVNAEFLIL